MSTSYESHYGFEYQYSENPYSFEYTEGKNPDDYIYNKDSWDSGSAVLRVFEIDAVNILVEETAPPTLVVEAVGEFCEGFWSSLQLIRRIYITPPVDGIWEYDFFASAPLGPATDGMEYRSAINRWEGFDVEQVKGVRVYGGTQHFHGGVTIGNIAEVML